MNNYDRLPSRRRILMSGAFAAACLMPPMDDAFAQQGLAPTPSCHDGDEPTIPDACGRADWRNAGRPDVRPARGSRHSFPLGTETFTAMHDTRSMAFRAGHLYEMVDLR
jgi:hypothetical protein